MGIDYETFIIFGWDIDYNDIIQYAIEHKLECDCSNKVHITVPGCKPSYFDISIKHEDFTFEVIQTSPWYDCDRDECLWYFGIRLSDSRSMIQLKGLISITEAPWYPELTQMVQEFGVGGDPDMFSVLNVS